MKVEPSVDSKLGFPTRCFHNLYVSSEHHVHSTAGCNGDGLE